MARGYRRQPPGDAGALALAQTQEPAKQTPEVQQLKERQ
jgi:hypothetical protein